MPGFGTQRRTSNRMSVGSMRHKVSVQYEKVTGTDDRGHNISTWTELYPDKTIACSIQMLTGREAEQARQLCADATYRVTMRYKPEITEQMRFVFGGRNLFIGWIDNIDSVGRFMTALCSEIKK